MVGFPGQRQERKKQSSGSSAFFPVRMHVMRVLLSLISHGSYPLRSTTELCIHCLAKKKSCPLLWNILPSYSHSSVLMSTSPLSRVVFRPWILCASWKRGYRPGYLRHTPLLVGQSPLLERLSQTSHS